MLFWTSYVRLYIKYHFGNEPNETILDLSLQSQMNIRYLVFF